MRTASAWLCEGRTTSGPRTRRLSTSIAAEEFSQQHDRGAAPVLRFYLEPDRARTADLGAPSRSRTDGAAVSDVYVDAKLVGGNSRVSVGGSGKKSTTQTNCG